MLMNPSLFGEQVEHEPAVGAYRTLTGCSVQGFDSTEPREDGTSSYRVVTNVVVFVPPEQAEGIVAADVLRIRGNAYQVEGNPLPERSVLTGAAPMVPVNVQRVTG